MSELRCYRYSMIGASQAGVDGHPQTEILRIAPRAFAMRPESIADFWFFSAPKIASLPSHIDDVGEAEGVLTTDGTPDVFTVRSRTFERCSAGSLVWLSADGWRFWLGEEVQSGVWTMGCDAGQGEVFFTFGVFGSAEECFAEHARKVQP